ANPRGPTLFPLLSCASSSSSSSLYAVGCVAVGHVPAGVTFSWTDATNQSMAAAVVAFPEARGAGGNMAASRLELPLQEGKGRQPFYCRAAHPRGNAVVAIRNPVASSLWPPCWCPPPSSPEPPLGPSPPPFLSIFRSNLNPSPSPFLAERDAKPPTLYVFPPPPEQLSAHETATVTCLAKGFNPPDLFIRWLRNGEPLPASSYVTMPPVAESQLARSYFTYSALTVATEDWGAGNVFTCLVGHERLPLQVAQKSSFTKQPMVTLPPSSSVCTALGDDSVELLCVITGFSPPPVEVEWLVDGVPDQLVVTTTPPRREAGSNTYVATSQTNVSREDWKAGKAFTCQVKHPATGVTAQGHSRFCPGEEEEEEEGGGGGGISGGFHLGGRCRVLVGFYQGRRLDDRDGFYQ
uniref:Ig-like domain-containing protein n=1 Tax=Cairina moschata TaxID=8855 RepID=A0A8C3BRV1_CAIMO